MQCLKMGKPIPSSNPKCEKPKDYCKWRSACPILMIAREDALLKKKDGEGQSRFSAEP